MLTSVHAGRASVSTSSQFRHRRFRGIISLKWLLHKLDVLNCPVFSLKSANLGIMLKHIVNVFSDIKPQDEITEKSPVQRQS